jgi:hypothetical protein
LLEWRSGAAQLVLAAALQPDVFAADYGAHSRHGAGRSRPDKLAVLTKPASAVLRPLQFQTLKIPPVKTSLDLEGQPVEITAWGAGRLWLTITGEVRLSAEQFPDVAKRLAH